MAKNMPWREAITEVLRTAGEAMHYTDIATAIAEKGLRTKLGASPAMTVTSVICTDMKERGEASDFIRTKPGQYMLRASTPATPSADSQAPEAEPRIIQAFGMYWLRQAVDWSKSVPRLLGQAAPGATLVDFTEQQGVYLLYDVREAVYVGRAIGSSLGQRLRAHTKDRLQGRWDRFSWFGLRAVCEDGKLSDTLGTVPIGGNLTQLIVSTMEALLIEGLEPRQNMRGGDGWEGVEYLQAEDPELAKAKQKRVLEELVSMIGT